MPLSSMGIQAVCRGTWRKGISDTCATPLVPREYYSYDSFGSPDHNTQLLDSKNRVLYTDTDRQILKGPYHIGKANKRFKFNF